MVGGAVVDDGPVETPEPGELVALKRISRYSISGVE